jgi:hypothetical protein
MNEESVVLAFTLASSENDVPLLQSLHDIGMNVDAKNQRGNSALVNADQEESVHWLLDHNANVDAHGNHGYTALMNASQDGKAKLDIQSNPGSNSSHACMPKLSS